MKPKRTLICAGAIVLLAAGCASPPPPPPGQPVVEKGPSGTIAYGVTVEASDPGARIVANGQDVGTTPLNLKIFGDKDGTFHDFGSYYYVVQALPVATNQYPQTRVFGTGRHFSHEDRIPDRIYFDMNQPQPPPPVAYAPGYPPPSAPAYPPPYYYYPYPYPYPYPYYWGPRVIIHGHWR